MEEGCWVYVGLGEGRAGKGGVVRKLAKRIRCRELGSWKGVRRRKGWGSELLMGRIWNECLQGR